MNMLRTVLPVETMNDNNRTNGQSKNYSTSSCDVEQEEKEIPIVVVSNAGIHPGTVVVVVKYARLRNAAMVCSRWFDILTYSTEPVGGSRYDIMTVCVPPFGLASNDNNLFP